jgi:diguanylate cyclase (GGDEF)-like protein
VVHAAALAAILTGLWLAPAAPDWRFPLAVMAVALSQLLRVRFRAGAGVLYLAWGEAALIVGLSLVPAGWLPLTFALGVALATGLRVLAGRERTNWLTSSVVASFSVAAGVGAAISVLVADPYGRPLTPGVVAGLVLAAVGYLLVISAMISILVGLRDGVSVTLLLRRAMSRKLPMFAGNVAVGVMVVVLVQVEWRLLLALPLVLVVLHSMYASRLRNAEHRRMWHAFARAARSLNQPDQESVAAAGARGAVEVFAVGHADVELDGAVEPRRWVGDHTGTVRPAPAAGAGGAVVPLLVAGGEVGRLRVHFPPGAGPDDSGDVLGPLASDDVAALHAYGDALSAALQDTVTHSELHQLLARSAHDAQHDPLTGLLNRVTLLAHGEAAVQLLPHTAPVSLLLVDVDHFREINDTLGHAAGDEVLKVTAARLRAAARPGELLARLGGDEFGLLVADPATGAGGALRRTVRRGRELVERLAAPADIRGVPLSIEVSVGVVAAPAGSVEVSELLRRAGTALYEAKHSTAAVGWYDGAADPAGTERPALLAELRDALTRDDELVLLLQPVVDLGSGAPIGVEALVRWLHPQRGVLVPADFIREVENSDLLGTFTEYVLDRALAAAVEVARHGPPLPVAANLSARSLLDPRLPVTVSLLLRKHRVPGRRLVLEITEAAMAKELPEIDEALASLRALGVRLAVDDFGTGYASLTFLTRAPLDEVKVDGALVAQMADSPEAAAIVRTTVQLGHDLGLRVIAEGVETAAQHQMLVGLGCAAAQGFHFAEPMSVERIPATLTALRSGAVQAQVVELGAPPRDQARLSDG